MIEQEQLKAVNGFAIMRPVGIGKTEGGLFLPNEKEIYAQIIDVDGDGQFKKGDKVVYNAGKTFATQVDEIDYLITKAEDILIKLDI